MEKNDLENENDLNQNEILPKKEQTHFLETTLGKTINMGLDIGIRALLPDLIEDGVIGIKNVLLENGMKEGIQKTIDTVLDLGKSALGIITGKFENVEQIQTAVKRGGLIDNISSVLDYTLQKTEKNGILNKNVTTVLKKGKNIILDNISKNIENELGKQISGVEKLNTYIENWKKEFSSKNMEGMEKELKKIEKSIKEIVPIENTIKEARKIENIHTLLKQKNGKFELDNVELALAEKLIS